MDHGSWITLIIVTLALNVRSDLMKLPSALVFYNVDTIDTGNEWTRGSGADGKLVSRLPLLCIG